MDHLNGDVKNLSLNLRQNLPVSEGGLVEIQRFFPDTLYWWAHRPRPSMTGWTEKNSCRQFQLLKNSGSFSVLEIVVLETLKNHESMIIYAGCTLSYCDTLSNHNLAGFWRSPRCAIPRGWFAQATPMAFWRAKSGGRKSFFSSKIIKVKSVSQCLRMFKTPFFVIKLPTCCRMLHSSNFHLEFAAPLEAPAWLKTALTLKQTCGGSIEQL